MDAARRGVFYLPIFALRAGQILLRFTQPVSCLYKGPQIVFGITISIL